MLLDHWRENSGRHSHCHHPLPNYNGLTLNALASKLKSPQLRGQKSYCATDALGGVLRMKQGPQIFDGIIVWPRISYPSLGRKALYLYM